MLIVLNLTELYLKGVWGPSSENFAKFIQNPAILNLYYFDQNCNLGNIACDCKITIKKTGKMGGGHAQVFGKKEKSLFYVTVCLYLFISSFSTYCQYTVEGGVGALPQK